MDYEADRLYWCDALLDHIQVRTKFLNNSNIMGILQWDDGNTIKVVSTPEKDYRFIAANRDLSQQGGCDWLGFCAVGFGGCEGEYVQLLEDNWLPINTVSVL